VLDVQSSESLPLHGFPQPVVSLGSGSLPPGLSLAGDGTISGMPTELGTYGFTVTASNAFGTTAYDVSLVVGLPASFDVDPSLATGNVARPYQSTVPTLGYPYPTVTLVSGSLPPGVSMSDDGTFRGVPTKAGSYRLSLSTSNGIGPGDAATITLVVADAWRLDTQGASVREGNNGTRPMTFTLRLDHATPTPITIGWTTSDEGSATEGVDFQAASGTVTIPAGKKGATFKVLVSGDRAGETDEWVAVRLSTPDDVYGASLVYGWILDDD
jgi:hypothetical protein